MRRWKRGKGSGRRGKEKENGRRYKEREWKGFGDGYFEENYLGEFYEKIENEVL